MQISADTLLKIRVGQSFVSDSFSIAGFFSLIIIFTVKDGHFMLKNNQKNIGAYI